MASARLIIELVSVWQAGELIVISQYIDLLFPLHDAFLHVFDSGRQGIHFVGAATWECIGIPSLG